MTKTVLFSILHVAGTVRKVGFPCKDSRDYTHIGHRAIRLDTVNDTVEMFVHFPPGFEDMTSAVDGLKYPTILWIHGGAGTQSCCRFVLKCDRLSRQAQDYQDLKQ